MSRYFIFAVTGVAFLMVSMSATSVAVAFPDIMASFDASLILAGWVLSANLLAGTAVMPLAGKAGDIFGGKRTFLIAIAVFTIGSLMCALAPNIGFLIGARLIQALGAGSIMPIGTAIVSNQFPNARQQVIGLISSMFPVGMIIGPNVGGWLVHAYGWQSVFWINIPIGAAAFIVTLLLLKPGKREAGQLDMTGAGLFTGMLSALLIAVSQIGDIRDTASLAISGALLAATVVLGYLFFRHEGRSKNPIIDLQILKGKPFMAANFFNLIYGMSIVGVVAFIPLYAVEILGMSTLASGVILTPRSVGTAIASITTSIFLPKWGYRKPMLIGTGTILAGLVLLGMKITSIDFLGIHISGAVILGIILFFSGTGMGMVAPAANNACIELMPNRIATISGVRGMFRQSGGAISIAVTALMLESFNDIGTGFSVVFYSLAALIVLTVPFIFAMPEAAAKISSTTESDK